METHPEKLVATKNLLCTEVGVGSPINQTGACIILVALLAVFSFRFELFQSRRFDPDEFEHLHAAWCVSKGSIPYRDFFEHHTPWFYYVLEPIVRRADDGFEASVHSVVLARS